MESKKERQKIGREKLTRIIDTCRTVEERALDPFLVDVDESIQVAKAYLPEWKVPDDLCLDAETIHHIASVIKLQSEWVRHRSTSLYTDPFLLQEKLMRLDKREIVDVFLQTWHPVVEFEQLTLHSFAEALRYWESLLPIEARWNVTAPEQVEGGLASREELLQQRILVDRAFTDELLAFWTELKNTIEEKGREGRIHYWDFVGAQSYEETVDRAFITSFLITYGYATLEVHPLDEEMFIIAQEKPETQSHGKQLVSIPIAVTAEDWQKWKRGKTE